MDTYYFHVKCSNCTKQLKAWEHMDHHFIGAPGSSGKYHRALGNGYFDAQMQPLPKQASATNYSEGSYLQFKSEPKDYLM